MTGWIWLVPAAFAATDWAAVARGDRRTETWAKPATLVALIVAAVVLGATHDAAGGWLVVALVFGLAGDVFLLERSETRFRLGLAAFLVGHLAFLVCFFRVGLDPQAWAWSGPVALFVCLVATRRVAGATYLRGGLPLAVPVAVYTVVIGAVLIVAVDTGLALIALGAGIFAVSDTVLARDRFVWPESWAPLVVMVTYHLGQALIVLGVLTR